MSDSEEEYWKAIDQKEKAVQTPKRNEVNPVASILQSSITPKLKHSGNSAANPTASTSTPASENHAGSSRQGDNISPIQVTSSPTDTTPTGRSNLLSMSGRIKVSNQAQAGPSSAQGSKSDRPLRIPRNDKPGSAVNMRTKFLTVIEIEDSDTDSEAMELVGSSQPIVRTQAAYPLTSESSQSPVDSTASMFSGLQVSSSVSSIESIESIPTVPKASTSMSATHPATPARVNDIFSSSDVMHSHQTPESGTKPSSSAITTSNTTPRAPILITSLNAAPRAVTPNAAPPAAAPISELSIPGVKKVPDPVVAFSKSAVGTELDLNVIAHDEEAQILFDRYRIAWGTQYEVSRGVIAGMWTWADARARIQKLKGKNADIAWRVKAIMKGEEATSSGNVNLWKELDREQTSIEENEHRGLGLRGDFEGAKDWYGGQIQQLGRLVKCEAGSFKIVLEHLEKRRSHRFARYCGSRRFLQVKIPTALLQQNADENEAEEVKKFLMKKFVLCGRVFVPFHSREEGLYMVETNEDYNRNGALWGGDAYRMSFNEFINWHNPIEKNYEQVISKYAARFALALSNSVPALEFEEENILFIDDITSEDWPKGKPNPPADKLMTDGCGFMNLAALRRIVKRLGLESVPAGVQGRIDGSKGFWILHPHDTSPDPKIWIRTSQHKIKNRCFDRAHRIFDHLGPSKPAPPTTISAQSITNLYSNNIPQDLLVKLMQEALESEIVPFLEWDGPNAMIFLAQAINKTGNVAAARTQRLAASLNRALGLRGRHKSTKDVEMEEEELAEDDTRALTGRNKYSGGPTSYHEMAFEMIQAGFNPRYSQYLAEKLEYIISNTIDNMVEKCRIPVDESLSAYIVPDPLDVLGEGEIYYRFSVPRKNPRTDMLIHNLEGDVVLGRHPIRLPSDMQKVKAVDYHELAKWPDVIIVSTKGKRSLASLLADGDMDGDEVKAIWDPEITKHFKNQPFTSPPRDFMERNFDRDVVWVGQFCGKMLQMNQKDASEAFQSVLLANLGQNKVGLYSTMHDNAIIMYGYGHHETIRLAYIGNTLLDASKSGRRLKSGIFKVDQTRYSARNLPANPTHPDIVRVLSEAGHQKGYELKTRYANQRSKGIWSDAGLRKPYEDEFAYAEDVHEDAPQFRENLALIRGHVDAAYKIWREACDKSQMENLASSQSPKKKATRTQKKSTGKDIALAATRAYAAPIEGVKLVRHLDQVKASRAYELSEKFAFSMAFQELCHIKAMSSPGGVVANLRMFDEAKTFASAFMRTLNRREEDYSW